MSGNTFFCVPSIIIIVTRLQVTAVEGVIVVDVHVYIGWFIEIFLALMLLTVLNFRTCWASFFFVELLTLVLDADKQYKWQCYKSMNPRAAEIFCVLLHFVL